MDTHKINIEKLQDFLTKLCTLCKVNVVLIKEELAKLKYDLEEQRRFMREKYSEISEKWSKTNEGIEIRFREEKQRLLVDHELELSDMKAALYEKEQIIEALKREKEEMKIQHQRDIGRLEKEHKITKEFLEQTFEEVKTFEKKLEEADIQKAKEIKEVQEKMHLEYKAEMESMRSR